MILTSGHRAALGFVVTSRESSNVYDSVGSPFTFYGRFREA